MGFWRGTSNAYAGLERKHKGIRQMIYIATDIHGRGIRHVTSFQNKTELLNYAFDVLSSSDTEPATSDTITDLCEKLYDKGIGVGARSHSRVSRQDAVTLIRCGAENHTLLDV
jgi:hypothetical protein